MTESLDNQSYVSKASFQFLLEELVPTSIRVSNLVKLQESQETVPTAIDTQLSSIPHDLPGTINVLDSTLINSDDVSLNIETHGYNLGLKLADLLLYKSSTPGTKIVDILDIMKFVCRDVWKCLYNKQMDNLRTNHRGTFVLVDNHYNLIANLNSTKNVNDTITKARVYLWFPCGVIRGVLAGFGVEANVTAEITTFPSVTFNILTSINN